MYYLVYKCKQADWSVVPCMSLSRMSQHFQHSKIRSNIGLENNAAAEFSTNLLPISPWSEKRDKAKARAKDRWCENRCQLYELSVYRASQAFLHAHFLSCLLS